jgi:hypothetical protein
MTGTITDFEYNLTEWGTPTVLLNTFTDLSSSINNYVINSIELNSYIGSIKNIINPLPFPFEDEIWLDISHNTIWLLTSYNSMSYSFGEDFEAYPNYLLTNNNALLYVNGNYNNITIQNFPMINSNTIFLNHDLSYPIVLSNFQNDINYYFTVATNSVDGNYLQYSVNFLTISKEIFYVSYHDIPYVLWVKNNTYISIVNTNYKFCNSHIINIVKNNHNFKQIVYTDPDNKYHIVKT